MLCKIHNFSIMWFSDFVIYHYLVRLWNDVWILHCLSLCNIFKFNLQIMIFSRDFSLKIANLGQWKSNYICGYIFNYIENKFGGNIRTFSWSLENNLPLQFVSVDSISNICSLSIPERLFAVPLKLNWSFRA